MSKRKGLSAAITRREMLKGTGLVLGGLAMPGVLEGCLTSSSSTPSGTIKIGYVSPITGATSGFGEPDPYVIGLARKAATASRPLRSAPRSRTISSRARRWT